MQSNLEAKYIISNNIGIDAAELIPIDLNARLIPQATSINTLGKHLLKAAGEGDVEEIKNLMTKGAPFTADWLGTSPLHLAALNNHLEVCEILIRAGICKDSRTKVDRTPLHMAAYEGHIDIVECLLKNNADYDCRDLLGMTPLHWAVQNGHAEVAAMLISYGAITNVANKFNLTPIDIAHQIKRADIVEIITISLRDPIIATEHLQLEMSGNENSTDTETLSINIDNLKGDNLVDSSPIETIDTVQIEDESENSTENTYAQKSIEEEGNDCEESSQSHDQSFHESIKLLQQHGITMLPADDSSILSSVMESGHSVVLTDVGKEVLNSVKSMESVQISPISKGTQMTKKRKKVITITQGEYLAMANGNNKNLNQNNVLRQITGKLMHSKQSQSKGNVKRIVMKKNKIIPISSTMHQTNVIKNDPVLDVEVILKQLSDARKQVEEYRQKLMKKEAEAEKYKQQLKLIMSQK